MGLTKRQKKLCSQCGEPARVCNMLRRDMTGALDIWCQSCFGSLFPTIDSYHEREAIIWRQKRAWKHYQQGLKRAKRKLWLSLQLLRVKQLAPWFILVLPDHCKVTN